MPAISNLNKAHKAINQSMLEHKGVLTIAIAQSFFEEATKRYNLSGEKVTELKAMKFDRNVELETKAKPKTEDKAVELTLEQQVEQQAFEIETLKACISEIATLAGYANYLNKYGLKRTEPAKRK